MKEPLQRYFTGLFFYPEARIESTPNMLGVNYEEAAFPAENGLELNGFFMKPAGEPKGTIVHCHGNAGNISHHYPALLFLVQAGYQVLCFDYQGYGLSEGTPTVKGLVGDARQAVRYVMSRPDVNPEKVALFGQSLGGAAAAGAMAREKDVRCVILEGTFTTYRAMAWKTNLGRILFFITPFVIPNTGPSSHVADIAPRPLLILHGTDDHMVPLEFAYKLFEKAGHKKALSVIDGLHHLHGENVETEYESVVLDFFNQHLE